MSSKQSSLVNFESNSPNGLYEGQRAITTQSYTEANVKLGVQYELANFEPAFSDASPSDFIIITSSNPVLIKGLLWQFDGLGFVSQLFSNPIYTGGTPLTYFNKNTRNPVTGTIQFLGGAVVSSAGTPLSAARTILGSSGTGNSIVTTTQTQEPDGIETLLSENSVFLLRRTSIDTDAQRVSTYATWYEGMTDLPL